jgi:STE24 endopeptidase
LDFSGILWAYALLALYAIYFVVDLALKLSQISFVKKARNGATALLSSEDWAQAADYEIASLRLEIAQNIAAAVIWLAWLFLGFRLLDNALGFESGALKSALFIALCASITNALLQPLGYYKTFAIDEKFGFNRSSKKLFWIDAIKGAAIAFVVVFALGYALVGVMNSLLGVAGGFALASCLFGVAFAFTILANLLFPYFARLFNKFEPIDDTPLGAKIKTLLEQAGFDAKGVFKIDALKRDSRLNAYFAGLGKTKRVALYDALIEKLDENEILAVLGHELGHFKHNDIVKRLAVIGAELWLFGLLFVAILGVGFHAALNLPNEPHITLVIYAVFVVSPIAFFLQPIINAISRRAEFAADSYGASLTDKADLKAALAKLAVENKAFPKKLPIYALWNETHPNILTRIERLS